MLGWIIIFTFFIFCIVIFTCFFSCMFIKLPNIKMAMNVAIRCLILVISVSLLFFVLAPLTALSWQLFGYSSPRFLLEPSNYFQQPLVRRASDDSKIVSYAGVISRRGAKLLENELNKSPTFDLKLFLQSDGGSTNAADRISKALINHRVTIYVAHKRKVDCASACVNVFSSVPNSMQRAAAQTRFLFHAPSLGFLNSYGCVVDLLISLVDYVDPDFFLRVLGPPTNSIPQSTIDYEYQRKAADAIEGPNVHNGRLQRSIDACPDHPFETAAGITLSWEEILKIVKETGPVTCPPSHDGG